MLHQVIESGTFVATAGDTFIPLRGDVDHMRVVNFTQKGLTPTPGVGIEFEWFRGMADDVGLMISKENAVNTVTHEQLTTGGFLLIEKNAAESLEAAPTNAITAITAANPAVVSQVSHGYVTGDVVRLTGTTGMLQIAGMSFHVTRVDANSYQLTYLDSSAYLAAATAGASRRYLYENPFTPRKKFINSISAAASAVVEFTALHGYAVGETIRFSVPAAFGMVEMDGLTGEITAIATNTVTVDINSTAFTAFAVPASGSVPFTQAHVVPVGDTGNVLSGATKNTANLVMRLAAGADSPGGVTADVMYYEASKSAIHTA